MAAVSALDQEECYLAALMDDPTGIDLAEAFFTDDTPGKAHRRWRVWDFQWDLYHRENTYQSDLLARSMGKSVGVIMRACAFPLNFPGQEMLITAPELNHLSPIVDKVEEKFRQVRFLKEMLPNVKGGGIKHQPQFQATFINGARIMGRLPQRTGVGVKGSAAGGTLILTRRGQAPIEDVVVGDEVFTHMGRWRPVEHVVSYFNPDVVTVNGGGHRGLGMSTNHRMLARRNLAGPKEKRNLATPGFLIPAEELETNFYFGSPTVFEPEPIHPLFDSPERCALAGSWVADGCFIGVEGNKRISIIDDACEEACQGATIHAAGYAYSTFIQESGAMRFTLSSAPGLADALRSEFGNLAGGKRLPPWLLGAPEAHRRAWLDAYLAGDGHWDEKRGRWTASTASKELAVGLRLLGQSLGWACAMSWVDPKVTHIMGTALKKTPQRSYRVTLVGEKRDAIIDKATQWMKVRSIMPAEPQMVYDLHVKDDHSYLADGLISHNQHPLVIEQDEGQDYPLRGWTELVETMKTGIPGAQWRVHGVSNGVRDMYYRVTSGEADLPFYVHKYPAMYRPTWSDEERQAKIAIYGGSRDNPDYKRNIYGEPGDVSNKVFVLARLMNCVRINESTWASEYNDDIYTCIKVEGESLEDRPIESFIKLPASHLHQAYKSFWAGMDLGFTNDPSELLIFGVIRQKRGGEDVDVLRLLTRIHLMRVSATDQMKVIEEVMSFYGERLRAVSLDKTGVGLPIWQQMDAHRELRARVKGYGFSEKRAVEFDDRPLVGRETPEDAVIEKNIIEFATDKLREWVDAGMVELPYDKELLTEFQGQVVVYSRESNGAGGRRTRYGGGSFHCVDSETEILTAFGWRRYDEVTEGHSVLTLDMSEGVSRWSPIEAMSVYQGPDQMVLMEGPGHSSLTTPNHRWPVRNQQSHGGLGGWQWRTTEDLTINQAVPVVVPYGDAPVDPVYSDSLVELLGWYWTEGNCTKSNTNIKQSNRTSPQQCELIRAAMWDEFGEPGYEPRHLWHEYEQGGDVWFMMRMAAGVVLRDLAPDRVVRPEVLRSFTARQMELFIAISEQGDGDHHMGHGRRVFQHLRDVEQNRMLEMACALAGIGTSTTVYPRDKSRSGFSCTTHLKKQKNVRPARFRRMVPYEGVVWCPSTRDGNWLARRKGSVYWTGNTLDAAKLMMLGKELEAIEAALAPKRRRGPVLDGFLT